MVGITFAVTFEKAGDATRYFRANIKNIFDIPRATWSFLRIVDKLFLK